MTTVGQVLSNTLLKDMKDELERKKHDTDCITAITKNGIQRIAAPPTLDVAKYKTDNKITDEEILKILEQPISKSSASKSKSKKKKKKKTAAKKADEESEDDSDEE
jgi:hypothetical protein